VLTADLVRASVRGGLIEPRYIDPGKPETLALAEALLATFRAHVRRPRGELERELKEILGTGTAFLLHRGLAKLLLDRSEFATAAAVEPEALRAAAFAAAAARHRSAPLAPFDRASVLAEAAASLGIAPEDCERSLYADLREEEILETFKECTAEWILHRYNLALAQAVLFRASALEVEVPPQSAALYRQLFRQVKFCQLLYRVEGAAASGYRLRLDGPLSLFKLSQRYGVQMANFLPSLLHLEGWKLEASVVWGPERKERTFRLTPATGLRPPRHAPGQWQPEEMRWLLEEFPKLESGWEISADAEIADLGGRGVLVPDYVFRHRSTGRVVLLEVFGFWRRGALESRLALLREHGPRNLILAISRELHAGEEDLAGLPAEVYVFRSAPVAREVLALLAQAPA
jgi:hypothetical protein